MRVATEGALSRSWWRVHQLYSLPAWIAQVGAWLVVALANFVSVPLNIPWDMRETVVTSMSVAALLLPVSTAALFLQEGPREMVLTASRGLGLTRLSIAVSYVAGLASMSGATAAAVGLPSLRLAGIGALLAGVGLLGTASVGVRFAWVGPLFLVAAASTPGLIPIEANLFYSLDARASLAVMTLITAACGTAVYVWRGDATRSS